MYAYMDVCSALIGLFCSLLIGQRTVVGGSEHNHLIASLYQLLLCRFCDRQIRFILRNMSADTRSSRSQFCLPAGALWCISFSRRDPSLLMSGRYKNSLFLYFRGGFLFCRGCFFAAASTPAGVNKSKDSMNKINFKYFFIAFSFHVHWQYHYILKAPVTQEQAAFLKDDLSHSEPLSGTD